MAANTSAFCPQALCSFAPIARQSLPFPTRVVGSSNDPVASVPRVLELAEQWGSEAAILQGLGILTLSRPLAIGSRVSLICFICRARLNCKANVAPEIATCLCWDAKFLG